MNTIPLIFVQLNEVNFDFVAHYVRKYDELPAFKRLLTQFRPLETHGEESYENLEPWIQWVSAQTGKNYSEHGVFRLGDMVNAPDSLVQVFETLESRGLRVGAISPMNARNRLANPAYFVPDPWTDTPSDDSGFAKRLTRMLRQTVNDNAMGRISRDSVLALAEAMLMSFSPARSWRLAKAIIDTRSRPWTKPLVLDLLLHLVHRRLWQRARPDVSFIFLNAGAHVQHHYLFNAEPARGQANNPTWYVPAAADPVYDMLKAYDCILQDYLELADRGARLMVATGLTQVPYDRVKYYYRLRDHTSFLLRLGISFERVLPRMTRDFEVQFRHASHAIAAVARLSALRLERTGKALFGDIDSRGQSVFATLTYPDEIRVEDAMLDGSHRFDGFGKQVAFVAIKNGMHSKKGFVFLSPDIQTNESNAHPIHVARLFDVTLAAAGQS